MRFRKRILIAASLSLGLAAGAYASSVLHFEGFEDPSFTAGAPITTPSQNWNSYNSAMGRVTSGTNGITSKTGGAHARIDTQNVPAYPDDYTGAFTRLGGYHSNFNGGFRTSLAVYLDVADPSCAISTYAWDLSSAVSNPSGGHRRDFIFHTAGYPGKIVVAADNSSNFTRRNDLPGLSNHYDVLATGWYTCEWTFRDFGDGTLAVDMRLRNSAGTQVFLETRHDPSDSIGTNVGGNRYMWFTFFEGMTYMAIDDTELDGVGNDFGLPVDLNGRYMEPGNTGNAFSTNFVVAATASDASNFGSADRVIEISNGVGATDATFTPFSDALKPPNALAVDPRGKSWQFDVNLGGTWTNNGFGYPARTGSCFIVGGKKPGAYTIGLADVVIDHPDANGYRFDNSTDIADSLIQDLTGANQFRIRVAVDASSNSTVTIKTLNGTSPGTVYVLGPGANSVQFANDTYFTAGFNRGYGGADKGQATATVSNFTTDAVDNVLYTYANDPYAKTTENTSYDFGMANLTGPIVGYQAFLSITGNESLSGGAYTATPFPYHIQPFGTLSGGYLSLDGETMIGTTTQVSAFLANVLMLNGAAGTAVLGIAANNGNPLTPTRFSDPLGSPITPTRFDSNIVVIDNTGPAVSINTPTSPVMLGNLVFTVVADDGVGSGLTLAPTILVTFSDATTVTLQTYAKIGNTFEAILPITPTTPCGATTATATAIDDSTNSTTTAPVAFTVNNATVTLTIVLDGSDNNLPGTVTRGMQIKLGGNPSTGTNAPFYANKNVVFSDPDGPGPLRLTGTAVLTALDGVPCDKQLNAVSVKDPKHTLRKLEALAGVNDQYTATLHLRGGDCTGANDPGLGGTIGDNAIDILDYGLFASQYGSSPGPNTPLGYAGGHSDFSGDGSVLTNDYTFISTGFLLTGQNEPGNFSDGGGNHPLRTCTIQQMIERGGVPAKIANSYDLNHDGRITYQEITDWLRGKRG